MKNTVAYLWLVVIATFASCKLGPDGNDAERPIIDRLTANPTSLQVNDTTTVTAEARDPQGESLTYVWTKEAGTFIDADLTTNVVHWKAPSTTGNFDVTLRVTNESGKSATRTVAIPVTQTPNPIITITSPSDGAYIASNAGPVMVAASGQNTDSMYVFIQGVLKKGSAGSTTTYAWDISAESGSRTILILARRFYLGSYYQSEATINVSIEPIVPKRR